MARILIADDQRDVLEALRILLKGAGHQTDAVTSLAGIFNALEKKDYALLMMDLNYTRDTTSGQEGLEVIPKLQEIDSTLPIVVMTAWATIDLAVEAMKRGGRDFVPKPWDNERLLAIVRTQIALAGALRKGRTLEAAKQLLRGGAPKLIAEPPAMRPVLEMISRVELADESTLFMDEIANIPLNLQAILLRVIETGEFERVGSSKALHANVRIISATNSNLHDEVAAGRFRQDLLFRLNTIEIGLPALRDRKEDMMTLANNFLRMHAKRYRKELGGFDETARERLMTHPFPGNVRELDHVIERAVLMSIGSQIKARDLGLSTGGGDARRLEEMSLEEVEAYLIKKALARAGGNASQAAEALGLSRSAFYRRLQQYGL